MIVLGAVYTMGQAAKLVHSLPQAGHGPLHLHLWSGPGLNQKLDGVMVPSVSSHLLHFQTTALCSRRQMTNSGMQAVLGPTLEQSQARLASVLEWPRRNAISQAQPRNFASVNGPLVPAQGVGGLPMAVWGLVYIFKCFSMYYWVPSYYNLCCLPLPYRYLCFNFRGCLEEMIHAHDPFHFEIVPVVWDLYSAVISC